jgi:hypothetical protein
LNTSLPPQKIPFSLHLHGLRIFGSGHLPDINPNKANNIKRPTLQKKKKKKVEKNSEIS